MPMAQRHVLDAARAAALSAHAAAGLALAPSREAARLLRSAESLARAAVAVLEETRRGLGEHSGGSGGGTTRMTSPSGGAGDGTAGGPAMRADAGAVQKRRRRRHKKKQDSAVHSEDVDMVAKYEHKGEVSGAGFGTLIDPAARRLVRHETSPSTPRAPSSSPSSLPSVGTLRGLSTRLELNGEKVVILRFDADSGRYVVATINPEPFRVKAINLVEGAGDW